MKIKINLYDCQCKICIFFMVFYSVLAPSLNPYKGQMAMLLLLYCRAQTKYYYGEFQNCMFRSDITNKMYFSKVSKTRKLN